MGDVVPPAVDAAANSGEVAATEIAAVGAAALDVYAQLSRASVEMLVDSRAGMRAAHEMIAGSGDSDVRFDGVGAVAEARLCSDTEMLDRMARGGSWEVAAAVAANTAVGRETLAVFANIAADRVAAGMRGWGDGATLERVLEAHAVLGERYLELLTAPTP